MSSVASLLSEAEALLWERAWSLEEVRAGSQSWSLAADAGLLHFLQEFSQQTISRTHEIKKQLDRLIHETKSTDCRLHNVFNGFLMLSNTQFIENRVYDDEVEEPLSSSELGEKPEQEKTREQKEVDLIPKIQEAVNYGLQVLDSAFEQLDIKAGNSDSEEETNESVELILEPKDLYIERPLPYLIGSQFFIEQDDVGLGDLSSEGGMLGAFYRLWGRNFQQQKGTMDSDRGSMIDSEGQAEEELEEFEDVSEDDQRPKIALISDEEDDLFGDSEKGEEDEDSEDNTKLKKKRPASFTDELAARIKVDMLSKLEDDQLSYAKNKKKASDKEDVPLDDDDIFMPPKLTDEGFLPFAKEGLFGGGTGLFDNEESDLFAELPKAEATVEKETRAPINDEFKKDVDKLEHVQRRATNIVKGLIQQPSFLQMTIQRTTIIEPSTKVVRTVPAGAVSLFPGRNDVFSPSFLMGKEDKKLIESITDTAEKFHGNIGMFDDDEFKSNNADSLSAKPAPGLFDVEQELFKEKAVITNTVKNAATGNKEGTAGYKSLPSSAENFKPFTQTPSEDQKSLFCDEEDSEDLFSSNQSIKANNSSLSSSKVIARTPLSLFDEEAEEELFGSAPKMHQNNATSLLFSSDGKDDLQTWKESNKDRWNNAEEVNPASEFSQKRRPTQIDHTTKKCLFEEEGEEDLFAVTEESQRKSQKAAVLFEDVDVNGDSLFRFQSSHHPSVMVDFPETSQMKLVEEKAETLDEPGIFHGLERGDITEQQKKEKPQDTRRKISLLEEDERSEVINSSKNTQKEIGKSPEKIVCSRSTGVFRDEELLFSHKLQKDNDPDVDLFSSNKTEVSKPRVALSSAGGIFGTDDDDDDVSLFSSSKTKPLMEAENKTLMKKDSVISSFEEHNKVSENCQNIRQDESCLQATETNLDIKPATLLPCGTSVMKRFASYRKAPCYEPHDIQYAKVASVTGNNEETGVSFDNPMQADTLQNANKDRIKMTGKRRPPTRIARRLAAQESIKNETIVADCSSLAFLEENCAPSALTYPSNRKLFIKNEIGKLLPPANSSDHHETSNNPIIKSTAHSDVHDLYESNDLFANIVGSKAASGPKATVETESHMRQVPKDGGQLSVSLSLDDANCEDLFQPRKPSKEVKPPSFLEDEEDLFTTIKKTVKRKDLKPAPQPEQDPQVQDIFEDDIFASEAVKLPVKAKTLMEANLFDDDVDIFADLAVKPKKKCAKKKMEAKSIFDEDTDDIFSPSHIKTLIQKTPLLQIPSGTKNEFRTSSTFEDPLNAFEGQ